MTTLNQEKYVVNLKYQEEHFTPGHTVEKSNPSKPTEDNRYHKEDICTIEKNTFKQNYCYCRVSTRGQLNDLQRQVEFFQSKYHNHRIIRDIGSGLNFKRKGLKTI